MNEMNEETEIVDTQPMGERTVVTLADIAKKKYISIKKEETCEFTVEKLEKVKVSDDFSLSMGKGKYAGYRYEITTENGEVLGISAWKLFGAIKTAFNSVEKIKGVKLKISHPETGKYVVEVI